MEYLPVDDTDSTLNGLFDLPPSNKATLLNLESVLPFMVRFLMNVNYNSRPTTIKIPEIKN
jgi:hypothetical protein